jgi:single-stranded DNA-binding protein
MIGFNGGLIGANRDTSISAAVGVWTPGEQVKARRNDLWPRWTPALITTAVWFDAADNSTVFLDAGTTQAVAGYTTVQQWNDKSGNNRHVSQATAGSRPAYSSATINNKNVLTLITDDSLARTSPGLVTGASARSMYAVYKPNTTGATSNNICGQSYNGQVTGSWFMLQHRNDLVAGDPYFASYADDLTDSTVPTTATKLAGVTYNGSNLVLYRNGTQIATKSTTLATNAGVNFIIGRSGESQEFMNGAVAEIIFTENASSTDTRQRIEGYLAHKWGLTASLPNDHPYKNGPP